MVKDFDTTIEKYLDLIRGQFSGIERVFLFGSYAKGKYTDDSDIDIALIFAKLDDSERFEVQVRLMMLASQIDSRIEPHPISNEDFHSGNPFVAEIKRTGIEIGSQTQ